MLLIINELLAMFREIKVAHVNVYHHLMLTITILHVPFL